MKKEHPHVPVNGLSATFIAMMRRGELKAVAFDKYTCGSCDSQVKLVHPDIASDSRVLVNEWLKQNIWIGTFGEFGSEDAKNVAKMLNDLFYIEASC